MKQCEECGIELIQRENERPSKFSFRRFCSMTCASSNNMKTVNKKMKEAGTKVAWNKGKKMTDEYRQICRDAKLGVTRVEKVKVNCETCGKELERTPGVLKFRKHNFCDRSCKGKFTSKGMLGKKIHLGHKHSEETIKVIKEKRALQVIPKGEDSPIYGIPLSKEHRKNISDAHMGVKKSDEHKKHISESKMGEKNPAYGKPSWNKGISPSPETVEKLRIARSKQKPQEQSHTVPALVIRYKLRKAGVKFTIEKSLLKGLTIADIFIEPNICIFVDGCYHHGCPYCISKGMSDKNKNCFQKDIRKKEILERHHFRVIRLPTHTFMTGRAINRWRRLFKR